MKDVKFLKDACVAADTQAERLAMSLRHTYSLFPLSAVSLDALSDENLAYLDMLTTRFSKLQDILGGKIFPLFLEFLGEEAPVFRDKLNKLEKLGFLEDAQWWMGLRELRNDLAHNYPDDSKSLVLVLNKLPFHVQSLLDFWRELRIKIMTRMSTAS